MLGLAELALLALVVYLVLGPRRLPDLARWAGRLTAELRDLLGSLAKDLRAPLDEAARERERRSTVDPPPGAVPAADDSDTETGEDDGFGR